MSGFFSRTSPALVSKIDQAYTEVSCAIGSIIDRTAPKAKAGKLPSEEIFARMATALPDHMDEMELRIWLSAALTHLILARNNNSEERAV